jgi:hypothetical protein
MSDNKIGAFRLEKKIAVGGMGLVYLATFEQTGQQVALKVLSPQFSSDKNVVSRFEREMAILKKLKHPNIMRYFGGEKHGDRRYYAMELMADGTLDDELKANGPYPWERVIDVGLDICKALEHSHQQGVIHRDLKPANLFFGKKGEVKLGDFGIARDMESTAITSAGKTVGTYAYMAPEQISGKPPVSGKTDLYALGCVLFELLTGRPPFEAKTQAEMLYQHIQADPPKVRRLAHDCPVWLGSFIAKLLEKDPQDRPFDALACQVALEEIRKKVAENVSVTAHTVIGGQTSFAFETEDPALTKLVRKKKRKKKSKGAIVEQTWFLASCLALLVGGVTWAMWPLGERQLYERGAAMMESEEDVDWEEARRVYFQPLMKKYPDGEFAKKARVHIDRIEMYEAEQFALSHLRYGRKPKFEAERQFIEAYKFEQFGDRVTAHDKYTSIVELFGKRKKDRAYVNLANKHLADLEKVGVSSGDRVAIVNEAMAEAERLFAAGEVLAANKKWRSITKLYATEKEFAPQVEQAQARLDGKKIEIEPVAPEKKSPDGS